MWIDVRGRVPVPPVPAEEGGALELLRQLCLYVHEAAGAGVHQVPIASGELRLLLFGLCPPCMSAPAQLARLLQAALTGPRQA